MLNKFRWKASQNAALNLFYSIKWKSSHANQKLNQVPSQNFISLEPIKFVSKKNLKIAIPQENSGALKLSFSKSYVSWSLEGNFRVPVSTASDSQGWNNTKNTARVDKYYTIKWSPTLELVNDCQLIWNMLSLANLLRPSKIIFSGSHNFAVHG